MFQDLKYLADAASVNETFGVSNERALQLAGEVRERTEALYAVQKTFSTEDAVRCSIELARTLTDPNEVAFVMFNTGRASESAEREAQDQAKRRIFAALGGNDDGDDFLSRLMQ